MDFGPLNTTICQTTPTDLEKPLRSDNNCDMKDFQLNLITPTSKEDISDYSLLSEIPLDFFE